MNNKLKHGKPNVNIKKYSETLLERYSNPITKEDKSFVQTLKNLANS